MFSKNSNQTGAGFSKILSVAFILATTTQANAASLTAGEILSQFNAVIADKFTSGHDVEGRLVANEMTGGATFYNNPRGAASNFKAINAINIDSFNANINNGGSVDFQVSNQAHFNFNGGGSASQSPAFVMTDFTDPLNDLANGLTGLTTNSFVNANDPNNFTFVETPDANGLAVFDLTTSLLSVSRNIQFTGAADTIIINVTGSSYVDTTNFNANQFLNTHIIWNFIDATSLSFQGWHGTVLAGGASVTNSSAMEGTLYALNFTGNGELHDYNFAGTIPVMSVPEPESYAMMLAGLGLLSLVARKRKAA